MSEKSRNYLKSYKNVIDRGTNLLLRNFDPVVPVKKNPRPTPGEVKTRVLNSQRLNRYIDVISQNKNDREKKVYEAMEMLNEIGFDHKLIVTRALGTIIGKMMNQIYTSVLVNEASVERLRSSLGNTQVLYLPSHRSYADFMLMSFICFSYNIEIPVIAAGMDFHGMMGLGEGLRKTGAFYMRRTFGSDEFYWKVFKEYMHEVITFNDRGLEFFIEGTRSRSCKALTPKVGLLSMVLEPYFMGEVHDLMIVPVSVAYEKPLEEQLFVYELLGIPKPKESTSGFFKAITNLKQQNLGKIYFDFDEPMSVTQFFGKRLDRFKYAKEPAFVQTIHQKDVYLVTELANEVVRRQQNKIVLTTYNLIALIYNEQTFSKSLSTLTMVELKKKITELVELFEDLGAIVGVDLPHLTRDIEDTLSVHSNIIDFTGIHSKATLIKPNVKLGEMNSAKLKGAKLTNEIMNVAVPAFSLQLYCNPTLYWLAQPAFFVLSALGSETVEFARLMRDVDFLRKMFIFEFVLYPGFADEDFEKASAQLVSLGVFSQLNDGSMKLNRNSLHINTLLSAVAPFINCYLNTSKIISDRFQGKEFTEKEVFSATQSFIESEILKGACNVHPYSLCLDTINMAVLSLCNNKCLFKKKQLSAASF
jgi:glyceronephosphate O-acyltransferase